MSDSITRPDRLKAAHEKLQEAVESIVTGEDWQRILRIAAKFHRYSFQNQLLIFCQRPDSASGQMRRSLPGSTSGGRWVGS